MSRSAADPRRPFTLCGDSFAVSGVWTAAPHALGTVAVAHGAGAGMTHPFMTGVATAFAARGISAVRFNFPYAEDGRRAPDRSAVLLDTWDAMLRYASGRLEGPRLFAAGKSMGGRMASMLAARHGSKFPAKALVFFGYPLHAPGRTDRLRDAHLSRIRVPMLFIQGTRDALARLDLMHDVVAKLGPLARLHVVDGADHAFRIKRVKRSDEDAGRAVAEVAAEYLRTLA